jgi:hypothetical protein
MVEELEDEFLEGVSDKFCGIAFVSFETEEKRKLVLEKN